MGMFDFLKSRLAATPGAQSRAPDGQMMQAAPILRQQPGLIDKVKAAYAGGPSFQDRAMMALLALQGDAGAAMRMRMGLREERRDEDEKRRRNEALRAAYDPATGKFDRSRYMQSGGDMEDALGIERDMAALAPKREIVEGPDGIYERTEQGWQRVMDYPEDDGPERFGWIRGEDGRLIPEPGGPYDPEYINQIAGVRREAVTSRPMPRTSAARPAPRGGLPPSIPPPPPGFRPVQP